MKSTRITKSYINARSPVQYTKNNTGFHLLAELTVHFTHATSWLILLPAREATCYPQKGKRHKVRELLNARAGILPQVCIDLNTIV